MGELYRREFAGATLGCYSERGLMAYFMFHVLPGRMADFLRRTQFAVGVPNRLRDIRRCEDLTLFSELGFGNEGFGNPDGAIWFRHEGEPFLVMVEVKLNQSYGESCRSSARYNSTIRGQLELKWRLMKLFKSLPPVEILGTRYVVENNELIRRYMDHDGKYSAVVDAGRLGLEGRRRLRLVEGVGEFFDLYAGPCDFKNIFYLTMTDDHVNPLDTAPHLRPRCFDESGHEVRDGIDQFCWMSKDVIEQGSDGVWSDGERVRD